MLFPFRIQKWQQKSCDEWGNNTRMVIAMTASAIDAFAPTCQKERGETLMASCNTKKIETRYDYLDIGSGPRVEINQRLMSRSHTHTEDQHNTQDTQCTARERGFR